MLVQPGTTNRIIHLSYGFHLTRKLDNMIESGKIDCVAPYPAYPKQFKFYSDQAYLAEARKSKRTIKVFFAGDTGKIRYLNEKLTKFFNVIPRLEVINFIFSNFKCRRLQSEADKKVLEQLLLTDFYNNEIVISEVKTSEEDWLKILSKADFFICPPGARMPWCHNCVEAMSVGTIPILEYNNLFYPNLENMENCLSFKNYEELEMVIKKALAMEPSEIESMRNNVINYYNNYLSVDSILNKIKAFTASQKQELQVAFPFISTKEEWLAVLPFHSAEELNQVGIFK